VRVVFHRVTLRAADHAASALFYAKVLGTLGLVAGEDFAVAQATEEHPPTRRLHVGFAAPSRAHVDAFWAAGRAVGAPGDGDPGPRPQYRPDYYGAFLLDPDGNSTEAVHHEGIRDDGGIDHVWVRVSDLEASRLFYAALGPFGGFEQVAEGPERVQFRGAGASFSLVPGEPTEHLRVAFRGLTRAAALDPDGNHAEMVPSDG
jgi:predicted lactoylglutathione lyase